MAKEAKRQFNVRLKAETVFAIETLAERWKCTQADVIERLVLAEPIPPRAGTINLPRMAEGQSHWVLNGVGKGIPTDDPDEFKIVPIEDI